MEGKRRLFVCFLYVHYQKESREEISSRDLPRLARNFVELRSTGYDPIKHAAEARIEIPYDILVSDQPLTSESAAASA
ncbi:MAG: hypothetical protein WC757_04625 [Candidatus Paceibacterota bacterium]